MTVLIHDSWRNLLADEFDKTYFKDLTDFVRLEYKTKTVYPPPAKIFCALDLCPPENIQVVILGQDPYHGAGQAHGLCFSVNDGVQIPPSLQNIYKEIKSDLGIEIPKSGNLERWANQGVLLLNATLTVVANTAGSHQKKGWETFTDAIIKKISDTQNNAVFMLWGRYAQNKSPLIDEKKHCILKAPHPSPLSAYSGFFGCKHFSKANEYLEFTGKKGITW